MFTKGIARLKAGKQSGISMVLVVCASAFLIAFSLAMLYTAGLLHSQANSRLEQERRYQLARSFAQVLDAELKRFTKKEEGADGSFYQYANKFLEGYYVEYDPNNPETMFHYTAADQEGVGEEYGTLRVALYKEPSPEGEETVPGGVLPAAGDDYTEAIREVKDREFIRHIFNVNVTSDYRGRSYLYSTEYYRKESYEPVFYYDGQAVVWSEGTGEDGSGGKWHYGTEAGEEVEVTEAITYQYDTSRVTSCRFENVYEEGGSP